MLADRFESPLGTEPSSRLGIGNTEKVLVRTWTITQKKTTKRRFFSFLASLSEVFLKLFNGAQEGTRTPTTCVATTSR